MESIENLTQKNLFCVYDLAFDIKERLQISTLNTFMIPLLRQPYIPRDRFFEDILPVNSSEGIRNYCFLRKESVGYLKSLGMLDDFEFPDTELYPIPLLDMDVSITVNRGKFEKIYQLIDKEYRKRISNLTGQVLKDSGNDNFFTFNLSKNGILYRIVNGKKEECVFDQNGLKYRIIKELYKTKGSDVETKDLADCLGAKDGKTISKEIYGIREKIAEKFRGLSGKDFIPDGKKDSGYHIGEKIKIVVE